ncbi:MAG: hypothetical protein J0L63_12140 [Anaerolineae bacterium]|nr:hypothetical protein [Anaerolineae bacterium]
MLWRAAPCAAAGIGGGAVFFVGAAADDDDKHPLGGSIGFFPPFYSTALLPLLLQKELAAECQ